MNNEKVNSPVTYKDAGVSIDQANRATERIKKLAKATFNANVLSDIGSFGGMFNGMFPHMKEPVLVASCDGVGTKLKAAFITGIHNTVGYDLVSHCISDILVQGARPLFFMDYIACGKLNPDTIEQIIDGMTRGCREGGLALLGGETAEMPGFYSEGEYDLAGFIVGVVDKSKIISGANIAPGDIVLGLPSIGMHTNGYSLARKLLFDIKGYKADTFVSELNCTVGEELLKHHKNYLPALDKLIDQEGLIKGLAHITGGGLVENIPRILPSNVDVVIKRGSWPVLPVYDLMREIGNVPDDDMLRTFNLGIGMIVIINKESLPIVESHLKQVNEPYYLVGEVVKGEGKVQIN